MRPSRLITKKVSGSADLAEIFVGHYHKTPDKRVEFVDGLQPNLAREEKWIINLSTQYGCPVRCLFCDAGGDYRGNVPASIMLGQVNTILRRYPERLRRECKKLKVHFSRMGEPSLNPDVLTTLLHLPDLIPNPNLWACVATIFPKNRGDWFARLLEIKNRLYRGRFQLQFSINSTDEVARGKLSPVPLTGFDDIAEYGYKFLDAGARRPVLNFALAKNVPVDPLVIQRYFDPNLFIVKLTPLNPTIKGAVEGLRSAITPEDNRQALEIATTLRAFGYDTIVSIGSWRENDLRSNCGQAVRVLTGEAAGNADTPKYLI